MQITIVVEDKTVICDGVAVPLPDVDWSVFDGDPSTKWDDVAAVQYNTDSKQGHVEYRTIVTSNAMRPNIRPGDMPIDEAHFNAAFGWILEPYTQARDEQVRREREAAEAAKRASVKAEADRRAAIEKASLPRDESEGPLEPVASKAELEDLQKQLAALSASNALLSQRIAANEEAAIKTLGGGS
ncbi:MAG: hypothetical protein IPL32_18675 [Chloracidobacterium sp.]|nr:hypothetical protein [Chloracidobacterium sp.]